MRGERLFILIGLTLLTLLMIGSFVGIPWNTSSVAITNIAVAREVFSRFVFSIIVMALILAVSMVGGIFLARREEEAP
jgi:NADH:ubiquinone oxidoreductase subunit 6 (subunit J)